MIGVKVVKYVVIMDDETIERNPEILKRMLEE